jgi:hypothetical protein
MQCDNDFKLLEPAFISWKVSFLVVDILISTTPSEHRVTTTQHRPSAITNVGC